MAKRNGMKVTEFFIGFGPRIWSFRRGETEYGVKVIPAGAYVKIIGMSNLEEVAPADEPRTYRPQSFGKRMPVVLAGPAMNFVLGFLLLVVVVRRLRQAVATRSGRSAASPSARPPRPPACSRATASSSFDGQPVADFEA